MSQKLVAKKVSQTELKSIAEMDDAMYAGASYNHQIITRYKRHSKRFEGTFYYAPTKNMMKAEDILLKNYLPYNKHKLSNHKEESGCTYVIKGKQRKDYIEDDETGIMNMMSRIKLN